MALVSGIRLGPYQIISSLGAGGMGEVYRARDTRLGRHVAIKVLPPAASGDAAARERFEREARVVSGLSHSNICPLFDIGEQDGQSYLVMECLEGQTLAASLRSDLMPIDRCLRIAAQSAEGLAHAHAAGVVHRDLKPSNVMVLPDGNVKLLDFGLARKLAAAASDVTMANLTEAGVVSGTVAYMSPEQATGERIDHRSDIFSLGVVIYETFCGKRPFEGSTPFAVMQKVVSHNPPPADVLRPDVPSAVARLLERMMAKSADDRPTSAAEIAAVFRQQSVASSGGAGAVVVSATPTVTIAPRVGPIAARPWRSAWVAGAAVVAGLAALGLWLRPSSSPAAPAAAAVPAAPAHKTAIENTKEGWDLLRRVDRAGAVDNAIRAFDAAIAADKSYASAWAGLARAYWRQHNVTPAANFGARALDAAGHAVALEQYLADGHVSLGLARLATGDLAGGKAALDHALVLDPSNPSAQRGLGEIAKSENRLSDATAHYEKAIALDPTDWELPRLVGEVLYQEARYAEALKWWKQAASIAPDSAVPFRLIGAAYHMLGDYPAAAGAFQSSLAIQPSSATYTNLGTALFYQGLYAESVRAFERAVEMAPSTPLYWANVGDAYRWVPGNTHKAKESYERAVALMREQLKKDPKHVTNRSRLALYLAKAGETRSALTELASVLTSNASDVNTLYRGVLTYELAGNRTAALQTLQLALDRGYPLAEVQVEPELAQLRTDVRFQTMAARANSRGPAK